MDITSLFRAAVKEGASDLLLTTGVPAILRIKGNLVNTNTPALTAKDTKDLLYAVLRPDQVAKFERDKELDFSIYVRDLNRFRGNAFIQRGAVGAAFRSIPNRVPAIEELSLPPVLEDFALSPQGLVLICGPTGHGKSTSQAAMIDRINDKQRRHIITVEDPIEYLHQNKRSVIEQREVGDDTRSFTDALRHVLRQDPDVILIGEMRDLETIQAALTAAETGHLVLATLHTNDCVQSIDRLLDVFPPHQQGQVRTQLSLCLLAVVSQRLIPRITGDGLAVGVEILVGNAGVRNLIREGKTHQIYSMMETHAKDGMVTMDSALKELYLHGEISHQEASRRMRNPQLLPRG
ncbi:MAG: PilT/PilU family type 4a pilus ATPase [Planctomycetes bacterium]|nr:PilT/PilU family type 4a pilus ATPase [Planctomycetota bacterium]